MFIYIALSLAYLTDEEADLPYTLLTVHSRSNLSNIDERKQSYFSIKNSLSDDEGLLFFEDRLIVPKSLVVPAATKIKQRACQCLFWLGMGADIENSIVTCDILGESFAALITWSVMMTFQIGLSSFSHGWESHMYKCQTTSHSVVMSANFSKEWNLKLVLISPRHSQSNELAEKGVGIAINILRRSNKICHDVSYVLLEYRNTLIAYYRWQLITHGCTKKREENWEKQACYYDIGVVALHLLRAGEVVYFKINFNDSRAEWRSGIMVKSLPYSSGRQIRGNNKFIRSSLSRNLCEHSDSDDAEVKKWGRLAVSIPNDLLLKPSTLILGD
ncbi:hypothetical protein PR048_003954, partial [Dryococelus australis]